MGVAIIVFLFVSCLIFGGYALYAMLPGYLATKQLEKRLQELGGPKQDIGAPALVVEQKKSAMPKVDTLVRGTDAGSWLAKLIEQSGVNTSPGSIVVMSAGLCACLGLVGLVLVRRWEAGMLGAAVGLVMPIGFLRYKRSKRFRKFEETFPEALDLLSRAIKAGHAFQTAMGMVAEELKPPVGLEFKKTFEQQNFGLPLKEALNQLAERVPLMDVRFFVTAVSIQRETGGNLSEILDNLAHVVRERFKILRQVRTHTAHGRFTGYVLLGLPAALALALSFISPDHIHLLFTHRLGQTMLMVALVMQTIGYFWIRQVIKIEV
jgi:tight adherence protein B